jgi:hypothetical protein
MARSHHRKKHKTHLQSFKHSHDTSVSQASKVKAAQKLFLHWVALLPVLLPAILLSMEVCCG